MKSKFRCLKCLRSKYKEYQHLLRFNHKPKYHVRVCILRQGYCNLRRPQGSDTCINNQQLAPVTIYQEPTIKVMTGGFDGRLGSANPLSTPYGKEANDHCYGGELRVALRCHA
jgi:hypothetical protein